MENKKANLLFEQSNLVEAKTSDDDKHMYIEGIFAQSEVKNGNNRVYSKSVMKNAIDKYINEYVKENRALGEINHPDRPFADPSQAAIRVTDLWWDGNDVLGKAIVLNTPAGNTARGLLEGGFKMGVSTRALGSLVEKNGVKHVQDDLMFTAVDCVDMPSGPECYVNPINESKWCQHNGVWVPAQYIDEDTDQFDEQQFIKNFENFLKRNKG